MRLIIIRHGQSVVNITRDFSTLPNVDTELTKLGHKQAVALRDWMRENDITADALYSSTLVRTRQTAAYVAEALGMEPIFEDRIREIGSNYADGLPIAYDDMPRTFNPKPGYLVPFESRATAPERVESWMHFRARIGGFINHLIAEHTDQTVYLVAHGGVITAIFEHLFNTGHRRLLTIDTWNTGWSEFQYIERGEKDHGEEDSSNFWRIIHHNRVDHLLGWASR